MSKTSKISVLIPVSLFVFAVFVAYNQTGNGIINYIDHNFPFNFSQYLRRLSFTWNDSIFMGYNQSLSLTSNISYVLLFSFFEIFGLNYIQINRLEYIIAVFFILYFTYLFLSSLFGKKITSTRQRIFLVLVGTFFLTNTVSANLFYIGLPQQILATSGIPLALFSIRKYLLTRKSIFILLILLSVFIITSFNLPYSIIALICVIFFSMLFDDVGSKPKIKMLGFFITLWALVNAYWILPMMYTLIFAPPYNFNQSISENKEIAYILHRTSSRYTLARLFGLAPNYELIMLNNNDKSLFIRYFAGRWYIALSYLTVLVVFFWQFIKDRNKANPIKMRPIFILLLFLLFIFLAKGLNGPFGEIYAYLFKSTNFFKMFRDSLKWMVIPYFAFIILMAEVIINSDNKIIKLVLITFLFANLLPWNFALFGKLRAYEVPNYYFQFRNAYKNNDINSNKRAVILDSRVGPTSFVFDTNEKKLSNNLLKYISPIPVVDLFSNGGGISFFYIQKTLDGLRGNDADLRAFQRLGATNVYHQLDLVNPGKYNYKNRFYDKKVYGKLVIYALKKDYILPKIFLSSASYSSEVAFQKINPTRYEVKIRNLRGRLNLNFLYTIDQNWHLYLNRKKIQEKNNVTKYTISEKNTLFKLTNNRTKVFEMVGNPSLFEINDISYIWQKTIFDDSHRKTAGYANRWKIDTTHIKTNYSKDFYKENQDGSIDVSFTLYFKPQSYFYLGLIISGLTLFGCIGYLGYDWRRRRKQYDRNNVEMSGHNY